MPDACREDAEASPLLGLDELILETAFIGRIPQNQADSEFFARPARKAKPLVVVKARTDREF